MLGNMPGRDRDRESWVLVLVVRDGDFTDRQTGAVLCMYVPF
jgi:hypothetical protein